MFLAEGFDGFIPKPIELSDLERVLKRVLPKSAISYDYAAPQEPRAQRSPAASDRAEEAEEDPLAALEGAGVSTKQGLRYCRGDREFYRSMLLEYAQSAAGKLEKLRRFYDEADWQNYAVLVHALKSTSKMIGAEALSETARTLEMAAKEGDAATIAQHHEPALARYAEVSELVLRTFAEDAAEDAAPEDEVLEFAPAAESEAETAALEFPPETEAEEEPAALESPPAAEAEGEDVVLEFEPEAEPEEDPPVLEFKPEED